jgi:Phosphoketolase
MLLHQQMAAALDWAIREINRIPREARKSGQAMRPRWPMLELRTPQGLDRAQGGVRPAGGGLLACAPGAHLDGRRH